MASTAPHDKRTPEERQDSWTNLLTGMGTIRDKRESAELIPDQHTHEDIDRFVEYDDMAARIVETLPEDMMREGWEVVIEGDKESAEATMARADELNFDAKLQDALEDSRAHGGAAVLLGTIDGSKDLSQPLDETRIEDIRWLTALPSNDLIARAWYREITEQHYGGVEVFEIREQQFGSQGVIIPVVLSNKAQLPLVHESRLLKLYGTRLSRRRMRARHGWGGSVLFRCWNVIRDFQTSWNGAAQLLQDFSQAVLKLEGLTEAMESGNESAIIRRAQLIDMSRSIARCVLVGEGEEFERKVTPIAGLPEMLQQFALRVSAAARMPVSKLFGQAPAGLNATGSADIRFWYDHVKATQRRQALPVINRFLKLLFLAKNGPTKGVEPENWSVKFNSQYQLTELEKADVMLKAAQADALWVANQVVAPYEVAACRFGGDEFGLDLHIDTTDREGLLSKSDIPVPGAPVDPANVPPTPAGPPATPGASTPYPKPSTASLVP